VNRSPGWLLGILLALLAGLGLGLVYAWVIAPQRISNVEPSTLRADFKDQYRSAIAAAYAATGNLPRAQSRLDLLGDANSVEALNAQAQRMRAGDPSFERADQVAALALALENQTGNNNGNAVNENIDVAPLPTSTVVIVENNGEVVTATLSLASSEVPLDLTETPESIATETVIVVASPRPTNTSTPVPGKPFALAGQETVCDPNLAEGLLQVMVLNANRRQVAGVEIDITWDGGSEGFFTGLKPELGNGYADYVMAPDLIYSIQLARGSDVARGITAPTCQSQNGQTFLGGIKLTFQQP